VITPEKPVWLSGYSGQRVPKGKLHDLWIKVVHPEDRAAMLDAYGAHLTDPETLPRLFFHPREDYGPDERLLPDVTPRSGFQRRPATESK